MAGQPEPYLVHPHAIEDGALAIESFDMIQMFVGRDHQIQVTVTDLLDVACNGGKSLQALSIIGRTTEIHQHMPGRCTVRQAKQDAVTEPHDVGSNRDAAHRSP